MLHPRGSRLDSRCTSRPGLHGHWPAVDQNSGVLVTQLYSTHQLASFAPGTCFYCRELIPIPLPLDASPIDCRCLGSWPSLVEFAHQIPDTKIDNSTTGLRIRGVFFLFRCLSLSGCLTHLLPSTVPSRSYRGQGVSACEASLSIIQTAILSAGLLSRRRTNFLFIPSKWASADNGRIT